MSHRIQIGVWRDRMSNGMQLDIGAYNDQGGGTGYRIAGPKFIGDSELLMQVTLKPRDVEEIRSYLNMVKVDDDQA